MHNPKIVLLQVETPSKQLTVCDYMRSEVSVMVSARHCIRTKVDAKNTYGQYKSQSFLLYSRVATVWKTRIDGRSHSLSHIHTPVSYTHLTLPTIYSV